MNKTIKDATVHRYYYESRSQLEGHLLAFINAYNFAKRLKAIKGLTPWEFIIKEWKIHQELFKINPSHFNVGLDIFELIFAKR